MSKIKKALVATIVFILLFFAFIVSQIMWISRPTSGEKISGYANPQKAMLVIDIQEDFTGETAKPPFPYKESRKLIDTVNVITEVALGKNIPVVYIRQELDGFIGRLLSNLFAGGTVIKGNPGTRIDRRVHVVSENIFPKSRSDAFSNSKLEEFLIEHQINELFLVGLDADGCVHATALGALHRGYTVHIITDAIVLLEEEKWDELLKRYREENIGLMTTRDFLASYLKG